MVYDLPGVQIRSSTSLASFQDFSSRGQSDGPVVGLHPVAALPLGKEIQFAAHHKEIHVTVTADGWHFTLPREPSMGVWLSKDRKEIQVTPMDMAWQQTAMLPLLRTAIECASAPEGVISLHAACIEIEGQAICLTAPSGTGKSTRAMQWVQALGATAISGDRPSLKPDGPCVTACGVPWDGKEQIYRNVRYPLKMICQITRGEQVSAWYLSQKQARQVLMQQTFLPMWDTEGAAAAMATVRKILDRVPVIRLQCGPDAVSAKAAYDLLFHHSETIKEAEE